MFRLLKSGLPEDPVFPTDLTALGYFVNDEDEVRMIANPRAYYNFFVTKNDRYNTVLREAMNSCLRDEILKRLRDTGLETIRLPLGVAEHEPNVPILISSNISAKKRVIIVFYEHTQDLGVFAYRIVGGRGGINAGSAVNFVNYVQSLSSNDSKEPPGIILANLGQLRWWRRGKKAVSHATWYALPQKSAVTGALRFDTVKNTVPQNRDTAEHVSYIFDQVVPKFLAPDAMLELIAVSLGAVEVVDFLDKPQNWAILQPRLTALALVATFHKRNSISNPWFAEWLRKRGRAYIISTKPARTPLAPPDGNIYTDPFDKLTMITDCYGCPAYSLGEPYYTELMIPKGYEIILDWFQEVLAAGDDYENPEVVIEKPAPEQGGGNGNGTKSEDANEPELRNAWELQREDGTDSEREMESAKADVVNTEEPVMQQPVLEGNGVPELIARNSNKDSQELKQEDGRKEDGRPDWSEVVQEEEEEDMKKRLTLGADDDCEQDLSRAGAIEFKEPVMEEKLGEEDQERVLEEPALGEELGNIHSLPIRLATREATGQQ